MRFRLPAFLPLERYRSFGLFLAVSVLAGSVSGLGTVWLLSLINGALNREGGMAGGLLLGFAGLCAVTLVARAGSDIATNLIGQGLVAEVRMWLARKVLSAPVDALERYRTYRLVPVLTHDVDMISDIAFIAAPLAISAIITLGCLAWLAWLSPALCLIVAAVLGIGAWAQYAARRKGIAGFETSRELEDRLHKAYRSIADGARELKINRVRRERIFSGQIAKTVGDIRAVNTRAINTFVIANAFGSALFFLLIALVLVWQSIAPMQPEVLSGFVLVLLFLRGPVDQIMSTVPAIGRMQVALGRVRDLARHFETTEPDTRQVGSGETSGVSSVAPPAIRLDGVRYAFPDTEGASRFVLGPIDLSFAAGRTTFIIGDNGSGKTTLIKLLLGLYAPQDGKILLDDVPVTAESRDDYRQNFSVVLSDFHLFDDIIAGNGWFADDAAAQLDRLELAGKVTVSDGRFTTTDLSTGQRKRLALAQAWIEGRQVIVFDEWAADQDPSFRRLFYEELLPDLKAEGRTLIVISHDDRYFHVADHVVRLDNGKIAPVSSEQSPPPDSQSARKEATT
ncbi:cyclic peptide export ABC transporter [Agrobacterium sp. S2]|nr:cyclic peptide export ABC transporter [Agrobacterium sp. S2]